MELVGRDDELDAIRTVMVGDGGLDVLVLAGGAGIGKTTLWTAGVEAARSRGRALLTCRPSEAEASYAYAGLSDLLAGREQIVDELPPVQRRALEAALLLGDATGSIDERTISAAFLGALRLLALAEPLCLAIDDVQWLDVESLGALRFALARLDDAPVSAVLAVRGDVPDWLRRSVPETRLHELTVEGLTLGATQELIARRFGATFARPTLLRLWETSSGNPLFALELAAALVVRGGELDPGEELPVPARLDVLLQNRLDLLSPGAIEALEVVSASADPTVGLVAAALGRDPDDDLREAETANVLERRADRLRFSHPLLRSAVATRGSASAGRHLHARLALLAATTEERARHLALSVTGPSRRIAAALDAAADAAGRRGAPASAAELADHSHRLTPPGDRAALRRRLVLAALWHDVAGDTERAVALLERVLDEAPPGSERAEILTALADVQDDPRISVPLREEALAEARGDDRLVATMLLRLADEMAWADGIRQGAAYASEAVRVVAHIDDPEVRCRAMAADGEWRYRAGQGIQWPEMEAAVALERSLSSWPLKRGPTDVLIRQLVWTVELQQARALVSEVREAWDANDDADGVATAEWWLSLIEWRAGRWSLANEHAATSLRLRMQLGQVMPADHFPLALLAAHEGRVDEARAHAQHEIAGGEAMGIRIAVSGSSWVLGFLELSLGDPAAAVPHLRRCYQIRDDFMREPGQRIELGDLVEALAAAGERAEAWEIVETWQSKAESVDRAWALAVLARCRGLLRAADGDLEGSLEDLDRAIREHERDLDPFQRARTLLVRGRIERRSRRRGAARRTLADALERFERLGAPLWAAQAAGEIARIGGRAPTGDELTEAEQRIAVLVAEGRTNREVAAALFLTEHSVETALTRIYRKLRVRSRAELARRMAAKT